MRDADVLMRLRRKIRLECQPVHVDDRVHRRADFVAHHREKRSLRPIRLLRLFPGGHHLLIGRLLRGDRIVDRAAELPQFAAVVGETRTRLEITRRHLPCGGEDRTDFAEEQCLADEPGHEEAEKRPHREENEVAQERRVHGGAIRGQRDAERDATAGWLPAKVQRLRNVQALDAVEAGRVRGTRAGAAEGEGVRSRRLSYVLLEIHRPVLDDALVVENGHDGARRKTGTFDESGHPAEVETRPHDGRELAHVVQNRCGEIETGLAGCRFGKEGAGRKVEGAARPIEREKSVRAGLAIERDSACQHFAGRAVRDQDVVVETIVAQGVDQLACGRLGERDDFRIGRQHAKPVSGARDAIVQFSMHQADDPRRHVAERGEAPLAGQPFVVRQDHERRHERHEDQRGQPSSHRRQERGDPVDYAESPVA